MKLRALILLTLIPLAVPAGADHGLGVPDMARTDPGVPVPIPVLENDLIAHQTVWMDYASELDAWDVTNEWLVRVGGVDFYAFDRLEGGNGHLTGQQGLPSLVGVAPASVGFTFGDLELEGVIGGSGFAYETFHEGDGRVEPLRFTSPAGDAIGTFDFVTAVVLRSPAAAAGQAWGYGQATLTESGRPSALFDDLRVASCEARLWFDVDQFTANVYRTHFTYESTGRIYPVNRILVDATDPGHGSVEVDAARGIITYTPDGSFQGLDQFTYRVEDCDGHHQDIPVVVVVGDAADPVAAFSAAPVPTDRLTDVDFTSTSFDDGTIVEHGWTFGDGQSAAGPEVVHRYSSVGTFEACLRVTDDEGNQDTACQDILVENLAPEVAIGSTPADPTTFDMVRVWPEVSDPEGDATDAQLLVDGAAFHTATGPGFAGRLPAGLHALDATATDALGAAGYASGAIVVKPVWLEAQATALSGLGHSLARADLRTLTGAEAQEAVGLASLGPVTLVGARSDVAAWLPTPAEPGGVRSVVSLAEVLIGGLRAEAMEIVATATCGSSAGDVRMNLSGEMWQVPPNTVVDTAAGSLALHETIVDGDSITVQNRLSTPLGDVIFGQARASLSGCPDRPVAV